METFTRRAGARLDAAKFDYQLHIRGLTQRALATRADLSEPTISLIRNGHPARESSLRKIAQALAETPVLPGAVLVVAEPAAGPKNEKRVTVLPSATRHEEVRVSAPPSTKRFREH